MQKSPSGSVLAGRATRRLSFCRDSQALLHTLLASILVLTTGCAEELPHTAHSLPPSDDAGAPQELPIDAADTPWDFGQVPDGAHRFGAPEISSVTPAQGSSSGGTEVLILGRGFLHANEVSFGGVPSEDWRVSDVDRIVARSPAAPAGTVDISVHSSDGVAVAAAAFRFVDDLTIASIGPEHSTLRGGSPFTLRGSGFDRDVHVLVGDHAAIALEVISSVELRGVFPPNEVGLQDLWVFAGDGSEHALERRAVEYRPALEISTLLPASGPQEGGTAVEITGAGLSSDVRAVLGGQEVDLAVSGDGTSMRFVTPPTSAPGPVDLTLHSAAGEARLGAAFVYLPSEQGPRTLGHAIRPTHGPSGGGNPVDIIIDVDLVEPEVTFGGVPAECQQLDPSLLRCTAPPHPPGEVTLSVKDGNAGAFIDQSYRYVPDLAVHTTQPGQGPASGGTVVTIRGEGFEPDTQVWFGAMPVTTQRFISSQTLVVTSPPGCAGPADIRIERRDGAAEDTLPEAFYYEERFRLLAVDPDHGSRAGNTLVSLIGTGFTPALVPVLGERAGTEIRHRGSTRYTFRTPPGSIGSIDVGFRDFDSLPDAFTYFNPETRYGGTWSHPIHGQVNLTVLDTVQGEPVEGAFAMIGTNPATVHQGLTDENGHLTFSGQDLVGPVTVTAGKEMYESSTFVDFDAENVTMYLISLAPPSSGGGRPPPRTATGIIRGFVDGIDKYVPDPRNPDEIRIAYVETTREGPFRRNPEPGPGGMLFTDGPYEIVSRPGDVAVVVVAGLLNQVTDEFQAFRMGVHRWLFVPIDGVVEDADVTLTVPLTRRIGVTLIDAPLDVPNGPNELESTPFFELNPEGFFGGYNAFDGWGKDFWLEDMPLMRGLNFEDVALSVHTIFTTDGTRPLSARWHRDIPWDLYFMDIGPFAGLPRLTQPREGSALEGNRLAWDVLGGVLPDVWTLRVLTADYVPVWHIVLPGGRTDVRLPDVQVLPPIPLGEHHLIFGAGIHPTFSMNSFEYKDLSTQSWQGWSTAWESFSVAD